MRQLILMLFFCLGTLSCRAQLGYGPELQFGIAGMHFQPNELYTSASTSYIPGFAAGGNIDIPITGHVSFQPGLLFSRKGDNRTFSYSFSDSLHESVTQKLGLAYLEVPVCVTLKTGIQGTGRFTFTIGVKPGYMVYGNNTIHATGVYAGIPFDTTTHTTFSNGNTLHSFDIALVLAAGYELPTGWYFRLSYAPGVNDIGLGGEVDKNRTLSATCGRSFGKQRNIKKEIDDLIDHTK